MTKVYTDGTGTRHDGSTIDLVRYDGLGRRIVKQVRNSADLDCTYHYYYDRARVVEIRDGSDAFLKQYTWGPNYVDELARVGYRGHAASPAGPDTFYYALHDANYDVTGVVDANGAMVERYEYDPYGKRRVYTSAGADDPGCHAFVAGGVKLLDLPDYGTQPFGVCDVGHQGLMHDEETGLLYNWARSLHPELGRFLQRDPAGYVDGPSLYEYLGSNPTYWLDPSGLMWSWNPFLWPVNPGPDFRMGTMADEAGHHHRWVLQDPGTDQQRLSTFVLDPDPTPYDYFAAALATQDMYRRWQHTARELATESASFTEDALLMEASFMVLSGATRIMNAFKECPNAGDEPSVLSRGKRAHKEEPVLPGEETEVPTPSGKRMDRYNPKKRHIREIKPNNPRAIRQGEKQVEGYRQEMEKETGKPHTTEVSPYDPEKYQ